VRLRRDKEGAWSFKNYGNIIITTFNYHWDGCHRSTVIASNISVTKLVGIANYFTYLLPLWSDDRFFSTSIPEITSHLTASVKILGGASTTTSICIVLGSNIGSDVVQQTLILGLVVLLSGPCISANIFSQEHAAHDRHHVSAWCWVGTVIIRGLRRHPVRYFHYLQLFCTLMNANIIKKKTTSLKAKDRQRIPRNVKKYCVIPPSPLPSGAHRGGRGVCAFDHRDRVERTASAVP
jgi:hypothetical protein